MERLWNGGFVDFENSYGFSLTDFEPEWIAYVQTSSPPESVDYVGCLKMVAGESKELPAYLGVNKTGRYHIGSAFVFVRQVINP